MFITKPLPNFFSCIDYWFKLFLINLLKILLPRINNDGTLFDIQFNMLKPQPYEKLQPTSYLHVDFNEIGFLSNGSNWNKF